VLAFRTEHRYLALTRCLLCAHEIDRGLESWDLDLRASRKSDRTRETYRLAAEQLADWLKNESRSVEIGEITRDDLRAFILYVLEDRTPATAKQRHSSLAVFFRWLIEEGESETNPMIGVKPPKVPERPIPVGEPASVRHSHRRLRRDFSGS